MTGEERPTQGHVQAGPGGDREREHHKQAERGTEGDGGAPDTERTVNEEEVQRRLDRDQAEGQL